MPVQLDPLGPLRAVWTMRHGRWLVIPTLCLTLVAILAAILFPLNQGIKYLEPSSAGIALLPQIAQQSWLPIVALGFAAALVVLWVVILFLAVARPQPRKPSTGKQDMLLSGDTTGTPGQSVNITAERGGDALAPGSTGGAGAPINIVAGRGGDALAPGSTGGAGGGFDFRATDGRVAGNSEPVQE